MSRRCGVSVTDLGPGARRQVDAFLIAEQAVKEMRAAPRRAPAVAETPLQISVAEFLWLALPDDAWFCHVPNGGKRLKSEAAKLKAMGARAGAPDLLVVWRGIAFFVEMKTDTGSLSADQRECHAALRAAGCCVAVARSVSGVEQALRSWNIPLKARAS